MKKIIYLIFIIFLFFPIAAQKKSSIKFNGSMETIVSILHKKNYSDDPDYGSFSWGVNNLVNLRFRADINEYITFGFAININMFAGNLTETYKMFYLNEAISSLVNPISGKLLFNSFFSIPFYYKSTYIGSFDLERLYFKAGNKYFDIETGLLRISRGFGYIFSPTDLFNPRNPLNPEARPEGKLSFSATFYPSDMWNIQSFIIAPDNPIEQSGWGFKFGLASKLYLKKVSFDFLYTLFLPDVDYEKDLEAAGLPESINNDFTQIVGFSMKADIEIGLFIDMIYRFDHKAFKTGKYYGKDFKGYEGLEAAIGIDYTLPGGRVYLLMEYMFYGSGMIDWSDRKLDSVYIDDTLNGKWYENAPLDRAYNSDMKSLSFLRHDYLFGMIRVKANDYLSLGNTYLFGIDDQSSILSLFFDVEPFQAFTINMTCMFPFDWNMLNGDWIKGEFGGKHLGFYQSYKLSVKVKF